MTPKEKWDKLWSNRIVCQDDLRDLIWYHIMGVIVDEKEDDLRVNVLFVGDSGSGKTEGIRLAEEVLGKLGIRCEVLSEVTDATLIGQIDQDIVRYNQKYDLSQENPVVKIQNKIGKIKEFHWKSPIKKGILEKVPAVYFSEAEQILEPKSHNERIQSLLREALDRHRIITKGVSSELIKYKTNSSLLLVSYVNKEVIRGLLDTGLIQRCFFLFKRISGLEHDEICKFQNHKSFANENNKKEDAELIDSLTSDLTSFKTFYAEKQIIFSPSVKAYADNRIDQVNNEVLDRDDSFIIQYLQSSVRRSFSKLKSLSKLNALSRYSEIITEDDFETALQIYDKCLFSMVSLLHSLDEDSLIKTVIRNIINLSKGEKTKTEVVEEVYQYLQQTKLKNGKKGLKVGKNRIWQSFELYEKRGFIKKEGNGLIWVD